VAPALLYSRLAAEMTQWRKEQSKGYGDVTKALARFRGEDVQRI
jgi:hypothetical protein